jgi:adenylate cyclase
MEIERKFLVDDIPYNLKDYAHSYIEQGYLNFNPEVRIRNINSKYFLTVKGEGTIAREEYEIPISALTYEELSLRLQSKLLKKNRYFIPIGKNMAELDVYINFEDLVMVEVEFPNVILADNFEVPDWFGIEVTDDKSFKNKNLALMIK